MGAPRNLARRLLRAALQLASPGCREWAEAMASELEYIEGEWPALFWALGCTTAIFRRCLVEWGAQFGKQLGDWLGIRSIKEENKMNSTGKKTLGVLSGAGIAVALGVCMFFLRNVIGDMLLAMGIQKSMWSHFFSVIVPTEVVLVIVAALLWKRRAPVSVGILVACAVMAIHVAVTLASH
jgi:hypothetical protein